MWKWITIIYLYNNINLFGFRVCVFLLPARYILFLFISLNASIFIFWLVLVRSRSFMFVWWLHLHIYLLEYTVQEMALCSVYLWIIFRDRKSDFTFLSSVWDDAKKWDVKSPSLIHRCPKFIVKGAFFTSLMEYTFYSIFFRRWIYGSINVLSRGRFPFNFWSKGEGKTIHRFPVPGFFL